MKITFYGAAGMVTGSNHMLEAGGTKILIDCGLRQGDSFCEKQNFEPFPYDPKEIAAVFVTHSHIDHIGLLPRLKREGFRGTVYSTEPTRDFSEFLLLDSEHILLEDAARFHKPPLYDVRAIEELMAHWKGVKYHAPVTVGPFTVTFFDAGHILGSSFLLVEAEGRRVVFSGDLGNSPAPIISDREEFTLGADYCVMESTYGDREHEEIALRRDLLEDAIEDTVKSGGALMIPAFAMERTQDLLFELNELIEHGRIPRVPIYLDSPLAIKLTGVYQKYRNYFTDESLRHVHGASELFKFPSLHMTFTTEESKSINGAASPKIIIAGAGMSNAGRILHHERRYLPDPKSTLLVVGYQAKGSLGRALLDGAKSVRIMGEAVPVRAKIRTISGYSAHADRPQLLEWLSPMRGSVRSVFLVHGEEGAAMSLAQAIQDQLAVRARPAVLGETIELL